MELLNDVKREELDGGFKLAPSNPKKEILACMLYNDEKKGAWIFDYADKMICQGSPKDFSY